jgi:hypothetical protein
MSERFPIVTYEIRCDQGGGGLGFGQLVETPDGRAWCFPSIETVTKFPDKLNAFEVNPARLKRQSDADDGRRCFVYISASEIAINNEADCQSVMNIIASE